MSKSHYSAGDLIVYLAKFGNLRDAFSKSFTEYGTTHPYTVEEHAMHSLTLFDENRSFNGIEFPASILCREQFRIMLALHDTGMEKVHKEADIGLKFGYSMENIQWLLSQPSFKKEFDFSPQEELVTLAFVSDDPLWQYMAGKRTVYNAAERIGRMANRANIATDSAEFYAFYTYEIIYFMCDAAFYNKPYLTVDAAHHKIMFRREAKDKIDQLESMVQSMVVGAVPFTECVWKPVKYGHLTRYAVEKRAELRAGKVLDGSHIHYRFNVGSGFYEIQPRKAPFLYDPAY
jgi:hypothetical protein